MSPPSTSSLSAELLSRIGIDVKCENVYVRLILTGKKITTAFALRQMASPSHGSNEHVSRNGSIVSMRRRKSRRVFLECVFYTISELYETRMDILSGESYFL